MVDACRSLVLSGEFHCHAAEVVDIAADNERSPAHVIAHVIQRPVIHPTIDRGTGHAELLGGIAGC